MLESYCCPPSLVNVDHSAQEDSLICVCDPVTHEILQCSGGMNNGGNGTLTGRPCWEIFSPGATGPCPHCPVPVLQDRPGTPIVREQPDPVSGRVYRRTDMLVPLGNGQTVHLMLAQDITDLHDTRRRLERNMILMDLLTNLSLTFASTGTFDEKANRALSTIGRFLDVDRTYILKDHPEERYYTRSNIWLNPDVPANENIDARKFDFYVHYDENNSDYHSLSCQVPVCFADISELPKQSRELWKDYDILSLLSIPLHVDGTFWGVLSFDMCSRPRKWSDSDLRLGQAIGGILSTAIERTYIEAELYTAQATLKKILDTVPAMIFWKDTDLVLRGCNQQYADYIGQPPETIIGKTDYDLHAQEFADTLRKEDVSVFTTLEPFNTEGQYFRRSDGRGIWLSVHKLPVINSRGQATLLLGVLQDITDRKENELELTRRDEELQAAMQAAEASSRAKSEFLSRMSHEIWTPMNAIIGMTRIASESSDINKVHNCLQKIDESSRQLQEIMNDILVMTRLSSFKMEVLPQVFDLEKLLNKVSHAIAERATQKKQDFWVEIADNVPGAFLGDEGHIARILLNLLTNAVKFTQEGGMLSLTVSLISQTNNTADVLFSVEDSGIGIAAEQLSRLFGTFEQLDGGMTRKYGGTGLGLTISKQLVELMGGEIGMESELGQGSRFFFHLPLEVAAQPERGEVPLSVDGNPLRLLVVDDCAEGGHHLVMMMEKMGMDADYASSGQAAMRKIQSALLISEPYDVILIDATMPHMSGLDTVRRIRGEFDGQPMILMASAAERTMMEREAREENVTVFLDKPPFPSTLREALREILKDAPKERPKAAVHRNAEFMNKSVLLVDDVDINREIIASMLEHTGVRIEEAENGEAAVEMYTMNPERYDLILMDIHMPRMSGIEATRRIRAMEQSKSRSVPIIAVTANNFTSDIEECIHAGMNDHIPKPVDDFSILETMRRFLASKEAKSTVSRKLPVQQRAETEYLPHIDISAGLTGARGNIKLYLSMLKNLRDGTLYNELMMVLEQGDYATARTLVRTLKQVAEGLSLKTLLSAAERAGEALAHSLYPPIVRETMDDAYHKTISLIDEYLKENAL